METHRRLRIRELTRLRVKKCRKNRPAARTGGVARADQIQEMPSTSAALDIFQSSNFDSNEPIIAVDSPYDSTSSEDAHSGHRIAVDSPYDSTSSGYAHSEHRAQQEEEWSADNGTGDEDGAMDVVENLRQWACAIPPVPHTRLDNLLKLLKPILPHLPKTSKTFLATESTTYNIGKIDENDDGDFIYFGLESYLQNIINPRLHINQSIELLINIDGLPLFKSSSKQFWPILVKIFNEPDVYKPFPAAIYCGNHKPPNAKHFFDKFIQEISRMQTEGLNVNGMMYKVSVKAFVCDRPARSFIKCIKNHGGYSACERCTVHGKRVANRTVYPPDESELRTDHSFRAQFDPAHHVGLSPLLDLPIDMVNSFTLDAMHLLYLGVMKKLLDCWIHGKLPFRKLSHNSKTQLSALLLRLKNQIPQEFQRTTRSLDEIAKFKATEFQFILLYIGPIIFKTVLDSDVYKHFMLLHVACRILSMKNIAIEKCDYARRFLKAFVSLVPAFYGEQFLIGNVHSLLHIADDVSFMQCPLSAINAFPFENTLGIIKKLLRNGNKPLAQICRRFNEIYSLRGCQAVVPPLINILKKSKPNPSGICIKRLMYKGVVLTTTSPNNAVQLFDGTIIQINSITMPSEVSNHDLLESINITGVVLKRKASLFTYPCDSKDLNMWAVTKHTKMMTSQLCMVQNKMIIIDISYDRKEKIYALGLLHM